jgi:hypothetical protein
LKLKKYAFIAFCFLALKVSAQEKLFEAEFDLEKNFQNKFVQDGNFYIDLIDMGLEDASFTAVPPDYAHPQDDFTRLRGRQVMLDIQARVLERDLSVSWSGSYQKITISGRPVSVKLLGDNIVVIAQFTPYLRRGGSNFLVAQGQVWISIPGQGVRYQTSMQTISLEFDEQVFFFPLGQMASQGQAIIELSLAIRSLFDEY